MSPRRAALYLQIPAAYCRSFGGLRRAQRGEAVEFLEGPNAGRTFAFSAEIGHFLEGLLVPGSPCPAFGSALHLLYVIGLGDRGGTSDWPVDRFPPGANCRPFREQGSPLRNAGALCGWLYRPAGLPGVADPPELLDLLELLNGGSWIPQMVLSHPMLGAMDYAEQPPVTRSSSTPGSTASSWSCPTRRSGTGSGSAGAPSRAATRSPSPSRRAARPARWRTSSRGRGWRAWPGSSSGWRGR